MRKILLLLCLCSFVGVMGCNKHEEKMPAAPAAKTSPAAEASPAAATPMAETSPAAEASPAASPAAP